MTAQEALSVARARLLLDNPFFGVLALRLNLQEDNSIPTLAVDGRTVFFNSSYVLKLEPKYQITALAHEVMHCVLEHISRTAGRNPKKWNRACDYAENPTLKEAGFELHPTWLYEPQFIGMTADEIYLQLPDEPEDGQGEAQCEIRPGSNPGESEELAAEWKLATIQAAKTAEAGQGVGKIPAQLRKQIEEACSPTIPWEEQLAAFMTERSKNDYSWSRPNPFYADVAYIPSMDGVSMGEIVIALDTSGSVVHIIDQFGAVVRDIVASVRPRRVTVIYCDASVNRVDTFDQGAEPQFEAVGGGGTDFRPPFKFVEDMGLQPACFIYLTDMYGTFPSEAPPYPVVWCATTDAKGPFGETLHIEVE